MRETVCQLKGSVKSNPGVRGGGIRGMRERLRQFKGEMKIESNNAGTRIFVSIPLAMRTAAEDESTAESLETAI